MSAPVAGRALRVLLVDDDPDDRTLVARMLGRDFPGVDVAEAGSAPDLDAALAAGGYDAVVTDYQLRWSDGLQVLRRAKERWPEVAVIMFTGTGSEEIAVEAMKNGLDDYVLKTPAHLRRLPAALGAALKRARARAAEEARRAVQEARREADERFHLGATALGAAMYDWNVETGTTLWSEGVTTVFGYELGEVDPMEGWWRSRIHPDDRERVLAAARAALKGDEPYSIEYRFLAADGRCVHVLDRALRIAEESGRVLRVVGGMVDITDRMRREEERERLEERLRQAQRMEVVGRLAGGIAHDFNNVLTAVTGYAELVYGQLAADDPLRTDVAEIVKAGERAASLTQQLLAFARRQVLRPSVLDLNAVVMETEAMVRRLIGEATEVVTSLDPAPGRVGADEGQLQQVIVNLAVNARDAMPGGGRLTIETASADLDEAGGERLGVPPGRWVTLAVADTGAGMDEETRARAFEPFFTTKEVGKGTGLGLATVHGIVEQSGGHVTIDSEPGRGTRVTIYLPRLEGPVGAGRPAATAARTLAGTETILLVEDEAAVRTLVREVLGRRGYRVLEAADGGEALRLLEADGPPVELLLTDVVMPGLGGPELAGRATAERPGIRVLFMSGYLDDEALERLALVAGRAPLIGKPFVPDDLVRKVRDVLDA